MQLAHEAGLPSPRVMHVLKPEDELGTGFIMHASRARPSRARFCAMSSSPGHGRCWRANSAGSSRAFMALPAGETARTARDDARQKKSPTSTRIPQLRLAASGVRAGAALARERDPGPSSEVTLVHGDFRHGNLIIGPDGVRAVLDWELAHFGDPMEDLGWICVNSWRFGEIDKPVGGFGSREDLFAGYEEAGGKADPDRVMFWEVMGTLRWGIMCCRMMQRFRTVPDHSMERAMIGRRSSETEIDLLRLLAPRGKVRCRTNRHPPN